ARTLVDIVVTHDLRVTFTDDRLNAQIQLRRIQNELDRGRSIATSEAEQTPAQKRGAGASASESTPERKTALQPDGKLASQQTGEVFIDCGAAPFDFDKKNDLNYFVRTITPQGEQRIYWGERFAARIGRGRGKSRRLHNCDSGGEQTSDSGGNPGAGGRLKANRENRCQA